MLKKLAELSADLAAGQVSSRDLVERYLARIADPEGEGARAFISVDADGARAMADHMDMLRGQGMAPSPLAGIPIAVKDLFDIAGEVTKAGSVVLRDQPPAKKDAAVIRRLRAAGMPILGRNNMTEFAYSGLGINPHYGTPANPFDRAARRVPGGSSAGAAVAVADGMAAIAVGTDTGGSCRIPAALCGIVGFKPTQKRVPLDGALPLSTTLDSIGPLGLSVSCCALLDCVLAGKPVEDVQAIAPRGLRLAVLRTTALDDLDDQVAAAFQGAVSALSAAGAVLDDLQLAPLERLAELGAHGGFTGGESYAWHRPHIERAAAEYDPRVLSRILAGRELLAADYIDLIRMRGEIIAATKKLIRPFDALLLPTTARTAPTIAELADDDAAYGGANMAMLRNPLLINFLDLCAISLPCHQAGAAPVGLMVVGKHGHDRRLFDIAAAIEGALA